MAVELPPPEWIRREFDAVCAKLGIAEKERIADLAIYELTDGTRTTTDLTGMEAYLDGGRFVLRLAHLLNALGCKTLYVLTTGRSHRTRENYQKIMGSLEKEVPVYRAFAQQEKIRLIFYGDFRQSRYPEAQAFARALQALEELTAKNTGLAMYVLIDYSADLAYTDPVFQAFPQANVIVKHTKGQINEGLWLPGKLITNSFVYVQNGSMSSIWSDRDLLYLIGAALRSMLLHEGLQYAKSYLSEKQVKEIRQKREVELSFIHQQLERPAKKRIVMFSPVGPEIYEF